MTWVNNTGPVRSLLYQGEPYQGKPTQVFAYYASPVTVRAEVTEKRFPGIVLVHGGGGKAFSKWAEIWARRGYAAIAMDLAGCGEGGQRLAKGGPDQSDQTKFRSIDGPIKDQWSYHAVSDVLLAHSLLLSFDEVDQERTAVTGISWGGYLTCIVAGLDQRFKVAMPVYGCGFLHENSAWVPSQFEHMQPAQVAKWVSLWDPSQLHRRRDYAGGVSQRHQRFRLSHGQLCQDLPVGCRRQALQHPIKHAPRAHFRVPRILRLHRSIP